MNSREDIVNATFKKLDALNIEIDGLREKTRRLDKDVAKSEEEYMATCKHLEATVGLNR